MRGVIQCDEFLSLSSEAVEEIIKLIPYDEDNEKQIVTNEYTVINKILSEHILRKATCEQQVILVFGWSLTMSECFTEWYDLCTCQWNIGSKISGCDKKTSLVVQDGHFVYAFSSLCTFKSIYRLDLSLRPLSWVETKSMYYQRSQLGVAILNYWIYAVGGFNGNHELNEVEAFDVHTKELKMVSSMFISRANVSVGVLDNFLYAESLVEYQDNI
ncbi:hypothetical protein AGLY_006471 [Aphis glycines]|uniref:BACK domain-containing protein n=1 Tax=Aphis glycines TaxID=307491 RepID=A0A6G0TSF0_APHGL|nr:hypothetical protein AGLY_006471 [Aphis glycines]